MDKPAIIKAEFTDYRPVKTRKVLQLVFEVPAEQQTEVFKALGYPIMGSSLWVAIAKLAEPLSTGAPAPERSEPSDKPVRHLRDMKRSAQAALKCQDDAFQIWLANEYPGIWDGHYNSGQHQRTSLETADFVVKAILSITSKRELDVPGPSADAFDRLMTSYTFKDQAR